MMRSNYMLLCLLLLPTLLKAQYQAKGTVHDTQGNPLSFVSVVINDGKNGGFTDIEGRFSIEHTAEIMQLSFRYVGFETLILDADALADFEGKKIAVVLQNSTSYLGEALILAGENPADILMRKVIKNRHKNNPEKRASYRCQTYNKVVFDTKPNDAAFKKKVEEKKQNALRKKQSQRYAEIKKTAETRHIFLMETVSERIFKKPDQVQETILMNRVSGFKNTALVALANMVQPFSFYGDYLQIVDKDFLNPISPNSPSRYFFTLQDTLFFKNDTTWIVEFHPRKEKVFEGLQGVLHISSKDFAVEKVRAQPATPNDNLRLSIEQAYQYNHGFWFPKQLNFEFEFLKYPAPYVGMAASGKTYIKPIFDEKAPQQRDFRPENPILMLPSANNTKDSTWRQWHTAVPLSEKEAVTYRLVDSIGQAHKFDRLAKAMAVFSTGLLPVHKEISVDMRRLLQFNEAEGTRIGFGLSTEQAQPLRAKKTIVSTAYAAYGIEDARWKYGSALSFRLNQSKETKLSISTSRDLVEPGALDELVPASFINRSLYARAVDDTETAKISFTTRPTNSLQVRLQAQSQQMKSSRYGYTFLPNDSDIPLQSFRFSETRVALRFAYNEQSNQLFGTAINRLNRFPAIEVAWSRGWKGVLGGAYAYNRYVAALSQSTFIRRLGRSTWRVEAGIVDGDVPIQKLFTLNQGTGGFSWFVVPNTFQTLSDTLWLSDRFLNLYFSQEIGPVLYRHKWSSPHLSLLHNLSFAALKNSEQHQHIGFTTARTPVQETGIRLDDLMRINYLNFGYIGLGAAVFYQWNAVQSVDWQEGFALRLGMRVSL